MEWETRGIFPCLINKIEKDFNPGPADSRQIQTLQETARDLGISPDAVVKTEISLLSGNEYVTSSHFIDRAIRDASPTTAAPIVALITFITIIIN